MKPDSKILDDMAKMAGGAVNMFSGLQQQIRDDVRARIDELASRMNLVPREDLDRTTAMVKGLRDHVAALEKRIAALEGNKTQKTVQKTNKTAPQKTNKKTKKAAGGKKKK